MKTKPKINTTTLWILTIQVAVLAAVVLWIPMFSQVDTVVAGTTIFVIMMIEVGQIRSTDYKDAFMWAMMSGFFAAVTFVFAAGLGILNTVTKDPMDEWLVATVICTFVVSYVMRRITIGLVIVVVVASMLIYSGISWLVSGILQEAQLLVWPPPDKTWYLLHNVPLPPSNVPIYSQEDDIIRVIAGAGVGLLISSISYLFRWLLKPITDRVVFITRFDAWPSTIAKIINRYWTFSSTKNTNT